MMQKKILVLAVAAAIAAPAAFADTANVTVYGTMDMAFSVTNNGTSAAGVAGASTNQVSSQVSKLGFKGAEDLGDGLSAIWQIEQQINLDGSSNTATSNPGVCTVNTVASTATCPNATATTTNNGLFATRNSFAGLKSDSMGTVLLGRHDTPYKIATRKLDVFADQIADNRSLMGGGTSATGTGYHDARPTDVVAYLSPAMNGFSAAVAYVAGAETTTASTQTKGAAWSLAGMYDAGPLYAALAYQVFDFGSAGTGQLAGTADTKATAWKLGGSYKMDALQLNAVYEKTSDNLTAVTKADLRGRSAYYLAGKYSFGNDDVKLAYTSAGKQAGAAAGTDTSAKQISLGYDHSLSKRTTLYAQYTKLSNATNAAYTLTTSGSTAGGMVLPGAGASPSAWSLGMKHSF